MKTRWKWNCITVAVLIIGLCISEMVTNVYAYSTANIAMESNELQLDYDLDSGADSGSEENVKFEIISQPQNFTVSSGKAMEFAVSATGTGLTYLWQESNDEGNTWVDMTCTEDNITQVTTNAMDGYQFRCVITDAEGNTIISDTATLTVIKALAIINQPEKITVYLGQPFTFAVTAEGTDLTYQWQTSWNAKNWTDTTCIEAEYTGIAVNGMSGKKYRCIVTDGAGNQVISSKAELTVNKTVAITVQPKDTTVCAGQTFSFDVTAVGEDLTYQWQISTDDGETWSNTSNKTAEYTGTATADMNGQQYRCIVTDGAGNTKTTAVAKITVNKTVTITDQPKDTIVYAGQAFSFRVTAEGTSLTYQWQTSTDGTWTNTTCTKEEYIGIASADMTGTMYRCLITDGVGNTETSVMAKLTVNKTVSITAQPKDTTVYVGETFSFAVTAEGTSLIYQWQTSTDGNNWTNTTCTTAEYTGTASDDMTGTVYRCLVTDGAGNTEFSAVAELTVNEMKTATITAQPKNTTVYVGQIFVFAVTAEGTDLTYQWQTSWNAKNWTDTTCTEAEYTGIAVNGMSGKKYRCIVTDGAGNQVISSKAELTVNKTVAIIGQPENVTVYSGESFAFTVTAQGTDLIYSWEVSVDGGSTWTETGVHENYITETAMTFLNGSMYRCKVTDGAGNTATSDVAVLTVE